MILLLLFIAEKHSNVYFKVHAECAISISDAIQSYCAIIMAVDENKQVIYNVQEAAGRTVYDALYTLGTLWAQNKLTNDDDNNDDNTTNNKCGRNYKGRAWSLEINMAAASATPKESVCLFFVWYGRAIFFVSTRPAFLLLLMLLMQQMAKLEYEMAPQEN